MERFKIRCEIIWLYIQMFFTCMVLGMIEIIATIHIGFYKLLMGVFDCE